MSYYAITIFAKWGLPPTSVAILFQVIIVWLSHFPSPIRMKLVLILWILLEIVSQATITLGYLLSPIVMRRVDTRPQVIVDLKCKQTFMHSLKLF